MFWNYLKCLKIVLWNWSRIEDSCCSQQLQNWLQRNPSGQLPILKGRPLKMLVFFHWSTQTVVLPLCSKPPDSISKNSNFTHNIVTLNSNRKMKLTKTMIYLSTAPTISNSSLVEINTFYMLSFWCTTYILLLSLYFHISLCELRVHFDYVTW